MKRASILYFIKLRKIVPGFVRAGKAYFLLHSRSYTTVKCNAASAVNNQQDAKVYGLRGTKSKQSGFLPVCHLKDEAGISLVLVLVLMAILGLSAGVAGSTWSSLTRRAREADLLWKGGQIRQAIGSYYNASHGQGAPQIYPSKLEFLLKDPRFLQTKRHLRRPYPDPMTGADWELIKDKAGRIKGVRSSFAEEPFKQGNFSAENKEFEGRGLYSEWEFIYLPKRTKGTGGQQPSAAKAQPSGGIGAPPARSRNPF